MADMSTADINDLPDDAFAYIEPGGSKDSEGKTTPRSMRHFPVHDAAHTRNALARMGSSPFGDKAKPAILAAAKKFGIDVSGHESKSSGAPLELRRRRGSMFGRPERRRLPCQFELRATPDGTGGSMYELNFYASTFNDLFGMWDQWGEPYDEVVRNGAFSQTLARPDLDTSLLLGHNDAGLPYARTTNGKVRMAQDTRGLHVGAQRLNGNRSDVRDMVIAVQDGDLSEASIGFVTRQQKWSADWSLREMLDLDLHRGDVSLVTFGANPATKGATVMAMPGESAWSASWQPGTEQLAAFEVDSTDGPDYDPQPHAMPGHLACPGEGCGALNSPDAKYCDQCSHALYSEDGTIILGDSGVPEELEGDAAMALSLARADLELRRRRLALLGV